MAKHQSKTFSKFSCGCTQDTLDGKVTLVRCALHLAAPDLLAACKAALADEAGYIWKIEAAVKKAEGK